MTRNEFMNQLRAKLYKRIPESDINETLAFYDEYFDEAGPAHEQEAVDDLGEPAAIAAQIISEQALLAAAEQPQSVKKGFSALWIVLMGLFAAPIALPLAAALVMALFGLIVAIVMVMLGFVVILLVMGLAGIFFITVGLSVLTSSLGTALVFFGAGLALAGLALLFVPVVAWIASTVFRALAAVVNAITQWFRKRFNKKKNSGSDGEDSEDGSSFELGEDTQSELPESTLSNFVNQAQTALTEAVARVQAPRCPGLGRRDR